MNKITYLALAALLVAACTSNPGNTTHEGPTDTTVAALDTPYENDRGAHPYVDAVDQYMRGLNEGNLEMILSLYAEDATVEDPVGGRMVSGIDSLRALYTGAVNIDLKVQKDGAGPDRGDGGGLPLRTEDAHQRRVYLDGCDRCVPL